MHARKRSSELSPSLGTLRADRASILIVRLRCAALAGRGRRIACSTASPTSGSLGAIIAHREHGLFEVGYGFESIFFHTFSGLIAVCMHALVRQDAIGDPSR
eukprot:TRINITY_DN12554_c0_g5_i3.p1 TRINITY_DN12554_c0_g5~~TRINITY_DN12554_c0_g5_i3.p1  ORF type:complete len:102 (-),score=1.03 TRINITY_DN12554_c0_g5_i3:48-353(-)